MNHKQFLSWGAFLRDKRKLRYRSARDFCTATKLGISYPQYSRYESGDQLPSLEQTLTLCQILEIPLSQGILEWNLAQVTNANRRAAVKKVFMEAAGPSAETGAKGEPLELVESSESPTNVVGMSVYPDDSIVFNRSHLQLFLSDPAYRDIFTYVNSFRHEWITFSEISKSLGVELNRLRDMVNHLHDHGIVEIAGDKCTSSKCVYYFPDNKEFFHLRNLNLSHNVQSVSKKLSYDDLVKRRAYRGLVTRELTSQQVSALVLRLDEVMKDMVRLQETGQPDKVYSLCMLFGERFGRPPQVS